MTGWRRWAQPFALLLIGATCGGDGCCGWESDDGDSEGCAPYPDDYCQSSYDYCEVDAESTPDGGPEVVLTVEVNGHGSVFLESLATVCSGICSYTVERGEIHRLIAQPSSGASLTKWYGCGESSVCDVSMAGDVDVTAFFDGGDGYWPITGGSAGADRPTDVVMDGAGRSIVIAEVAAAADFGREVHAGGAGGLVAAFAPDGDYLWSTRLPVAGVAAAWLPGGGVVIAGSFYDQVAFGDVVLSSAGARDIFVVELSDGGSVARAWSYGGPGDEIVTDVATAPDGSLALTGELNGLGNLGGDDIVAPDWPEPPRAFVARYATTGDHLWSNGYGGAASGTRVEIGADGDVVVAGVFVDAIDLGDGVRTGAGMGDVFIARFDYDGLLVWAVTGGGPGADSPRGLAVDAATNVVVGGTFVGSVTFGGVTLDGDPTSEQGFVAMFDPGGAPSWSIPVIGSSGAGIAAVDADDLGHVWLAGWYDGVVTVDSFSMASLAGTDVVLVRLAADTGIAEWARRYGGNGVDAGTVLALDSAGGPIVGGTYTDVGMFADAEEHSRGDADVFLYRPY